MSCRGSMPLTGIALALLAAPLISQASQTVDEWSCTAPKFLGDAALAHAGYSVSCGDWNGDGLSDIALGGIHSNTMAPPPALSEAWIVLGPAEASMSAALKITGIGTPNLGAVVSFIGDINRGGKDDLAIGAPWWTDDPANPEKGIVYIFFGEGHGLLACSASEVSAPSCSNVVLVGDKPYGRFGTSIARLGDVDGDGFPDFAVGAPGSAAAPEPVTDPGHVFVYRGSDDPIGVASVGFPAGPGGFPQQVYPDAWRAAQIITGAAAHDRFGWAIAGRIDVDADGLDDMVVTAPQALETSLVGFGWKGVGTSTGYAKVFSFNPVGPAIERFKLDLPVLGAQESAIAFGLSVATIGSLDADATRDIVVGVPLYDNHGAVAQGCVFVFRSGNGFSWPAGPIYPGAGGTAEVGENNRFGWALAEGDDLEPDGVPDFFVSAPFFVNPPSPCGGPLPVPQGGRIFVMSGAGIGSSSVLMRFAGGGARDRVGLALTSGRMNADGLLDVVGGAAGHSPSERVPETGAVYVFMTF